MSEVTPDDLLAAYRFGIFPMAESQDADELFWLDPEYRGILPLDGFHLSRSLAKVIKSNRFRISFDTAFRAVMEGCANRPETWINAEIYVLYGALHQRGAAHSVEVWEGDVLVGGAYGVSTGAAFMGESMFSTRCDASKVALAYLVHRLKIGGYLLLDTQFLTPHLASLGGIEIPRHSYRQALAQALEYEGRFKQPLASAQEVVQLIGQTS